MNKSNYKATIQIQSLLVVEVHVLGGNIAPSLTKLPFKLNLRLIR